MVNQASRDLDSAKRIATYQRMQRLAQERAPFAWMMQQIATAVLGKGVSGFEIGPLPDYTNYAGIKKA
jgi:peptide/nickel transport system substrate-binding protein